MNERILREDPRLTESNVLNCEPNNILEKMLKEDPTRAKLLNESELPKRSVSNIEILLPNRS
jgi:hypothetical protein